MMPSNPEFPSNPPDETPLTGNPTDPDERGTLIGIGGQYTVHDIGGGRVIKIPNSMDGTRQYVGGWGPHVSKMKRHIPLEITAVLRDFCVPHVLRLAARYPILMDALARPLMAPGGCFTQDKVRPLRGVLSEATPAEVYRYLDETADIYQLLWRYGIHDNIWFFMVNNGINAQGKVVCLDFGETAFDTTWVEASVKNRGWETKDVLIKETLPPEYHAHYFKAMTSRLSGRNFELHWTKSLDDLDKMIIKKPTLSERPEDIPLLIEQILERANQEEGWDINGVSADVLDLFCQYNWEGVSDGVPPDVMDLFRQYDLKGSGVELQNVLYRAGQACQEGIIQVDDLPQYIQVKK